MSKIKDEAERELREREIEMDKEAPEKTRNDRLMNEVCEKNYRSSKIPLMNYDEDDYQQDHDNQLVR